MYKLLRIGTIIIIIVGIIFCVFFGKKTQDTFSYTKNDVNKSLLNNEMQVTTVAFNHEDEDLRGVVYEWHSKTKELSDLEKLSIAVVKVELDENYAREVYTNSTLSKVQIIESYSGDLKVGDCISIFEPCAVGGEDMMSLDGYMPLRSSQEYILFLKKLKNSRFGKDEYIYIPTSTVFGKYSLETYEPKLLGEESIEESILYKDVREQDVIFEEKELLEIFKNIRKEVFEKYVE